MIGEGQGVYSFVHIDDAAGATAAALECVPGAYNIVDGNPSPQRVWLPAFARAAGAPAPPHVSEEEALRTSGPDAVAKMITLSLAQGADRERLPRNQGGLPAKEVSLAGQSEPWSHQKNGLERCAFRFTHIQRS